MHKGNEISQQSEGNLNGGIANHLCRDMVTIAVTGIPLSEDVIGNFIMENGKHKVITAQSNKIHYSGTGDLFAAVFLGECLRGGSAFDAADLASRFILASVRDTAKDTPPRAGVEYEKNLKILMDRA